jgi:hypothetical protein
MRSSNTIVRRIPNYCLTYFLLDKQSLGYESVSNCLVAQCINYRLRRGKIDLEKHKFFTAVTMKDAAFWDVTPCNSC